MEEAKRRLTMIRLVLELIEEFIVLVFLELKLAAVEIRHHIRSAETGAVLMAVGASLLLFALITCIGSAVAALAIALPLWLSALVVAVSLALIGAALLFTGLGKLKHFSLVPSDTVHRIQVISKKLKAMH